MLTGSLTEPLSVTVVPAPRFPLLPFAICVDSLRIANRVCGRPAFMHTVATPDGGPAMSSSAIPVPADISIDDIGFAPVVVLLASYEPEAACTPQLMAWLRRQDRQGATLLCSDTGAIVLARAGVLRGRRVAVHHESMPAYLATQGETEVFDRMHGYDRGLGSSIGGIPTLDMMLELIARQTEQSVADGVAHVMGHQRLPSESVKVARTADAAISMVDRRLGRMVALMQTHLEDPLPIEELCRLCHLDPSTARRLFRKRFRRGPGRYYLDLRLDRARLLLANSPLPVREIAGLVGFADTSAFTRAFKRRFGRLPSASREQPSGAL